MGSWGTSTWGSTSWGGGATSISIASARAITAQRVLVTLSDLPLAVSAVSSADALNPATWVVTHTATGNVLTVSAATARSTTEYYVDVVEALVGPAHARAYTVGSTTLRSSGGALISAPTSAAFEGFLSTVSQGERTTGVVDLANPPLPGPLSTGGTLIITTGGDYATESGDALLEKLILRRLTTPRGGFPHLPDYGAGIALKAPVNAGSLRLVQADLQRQLALEPEVAEARVALDITAQGVLTVGVRVRTRAGGVITTGYQTAVA